MKSKIIILIAGIMLLTILPFSSALSHEQVKQLKLCNHDCLTQQKIELNNCSQEYKECRTLLNSTRSSCSSERRICMAEASTNLKSCKKQCTIDFGLKCLRGNNSYGVGENFTEGCNICECGKTGRISCKKDAFCNKEPLTDQSKCESNNGLFYAFCNGPYFDIVCSQKSFCLCSGNNNYSCPSGYECLTDFVSPNKRTTLSGWKTLLGKPLGEVGVCVK